MHSYNRKEFPTTEEVIEKVERLAGYEGQKIMVYGYPFFAWYPCIKINETVANYDRRYW